MIEKVNIHEKGRCLNLDTGLCKIDIIGGWGVTLNNFFISLKKLSNGEKIPVKRIPIGIQSWDFGSRSKRIFKADIVQPGEYEIEFHNQEDIIVKKSNLILISFFEKPLPNHSLEIGITN